MHPAAETPLAPRQRWRITFARDADPARRAHRELADEWIAALVRSGLPVARPAGRPRSPLTFAAPLPAGLACHAELADIVLAELCPAWWVRERIEASVPSGMRVISIVDVWLGAPPLAAAIRGAEYRVPIEEKDTASVADAATALLRAPTLERDRLRGGARVRYDIRPLVDDVHVDAGEPPILVMRARVDPERGAGRPDEIIAALGDLRGEPFDTGPIARTRLILDE